MLSATFASILWESVQKRKKMIIKKKHAKRVTKFLSYGKEEGLERKRGNVSID